MCFISGFSNEQNISSPEYASLKISTLHVVKLPRLLFLFQALFISVDHSQSEKLVIYSTSIQVSFLRHKENSVRRPLIVRYDFNLTWSSDNPIALIQLWMKDRFNPPLLSARRLAPTCTLHCRLLFNVIPRAALPRRTVLVSVCTTYSFVYSSLRGMSCVGSTGKLQKSYGFT